MSRYIEADATRDLLIMSISLTNGIDTALKEAPSVDIVRCKECRFYLADEGKCTRSIWVYDWHRPKTKADDFCSYAERKNNE